MAIGMRMKCHSIIGYMQKIQIILLSVHVHVIMKIIFASSMDIFSTTNSSFCSSSIPLAGT